MRNRLWQRLLAGALGAVAVGGLILNMTTARDLDRTTNSFASNSFVITSLVNADRQTHKVMELARSMRGPDDLSTLLLNRELLERHLQLVGVAVPVGHLQWPLLAAVKETLATADRTLAALSPASSSVELRLASAELWRDFTETELRIKRLYDSSEAVYFGTQRTALDAGRQSQRVLVGAGILTALLGLVLVLSIRRTASADLRSAYAGLLSETADRTQAEHALRQSERRFRALVHKASDVISVLDAGAVVRYQSPAVQTALGLAPDEVIGRSLLDLVHADELAAARTLFDASLRQSGQPQTAAISLQCGTTARLFEMTMTNLLDDPDVTGIIVNYRDITDRVTLEQQLTHLAYHDALTGLPNRTAFHDRLAVAATRDVDVAVLFIDLDHFKLVNDSLGHSAGDVLLCQVAHRLASCLRSGDLLARLGGDEFTVVTQGEPRLPDVCLLAQRILKALDAPFLVEGQPLFVDASIGVATARAGRVIAEDLVCNADAAMYEAKERGRGRVEIYEEGQHDRIVHRLALHTALRGALATGELTLHYQPIVDIRTGETRAFEALARWHPPGGDSVPPDVFIPIAEETGLIKPLGQWVLREACQQLVAWQRAGLVGDDVRMNVNLSAIQFRDPQLLSDIAGTLAETGLGPSLLTVELTETAILADRAAANETLVALRALGVNVALDDFGIGYSSLSCLAELPIDTLKIDRSFVAGLTIGSRSYAIVEAIVRLAQSLGMQSTAEGVENAEQARLLATMGCSHAQGYLFARPVAPAEITAALTANAVPAA